MVDPQTLITAIPRVCKGWRAVVRQTAAHFRPQLDLLWCTRPLPKQDAPFGEPLQINILHRLLKGFPGAESLRFSSRHGLCGGATEWLAGHLRQDPSCRISELTFVGSGSGSGTSRKDDALTNEALGRLVTSLCRSNIPPKRSNIPPQRSWRGLTSFAYTFSKNVSVPLLEALANSCPNLQSLCLRGCDLGHLSDAYFASVAKAFPKLNELNLRKCDVSDGALGAFVSGCSKLTALNLFHCSRVTDASLTEVGANCSKLAVLNLNQCHLVTDGGLAQIGSNCSELRVLTLHDCGQVTDVGVGSIAAGCHKLHSLNLTYCEMVSDDGMSALAAGCPAMAKITVAYCWRITEAGRSLFGDGVVTSWY
jgi:hypothetical protein